MRGSLPNGHLTLTDGSHVRLRPICADDVEGLRETFRSLSPESRFLRFLMGTADLSDGALAYLTDVDGKNHVAIAAVQESLDLKVERIVGVARFVRLEDDPTVAEVAVTVIDELQGRGLGAILLRAIRDAALSLGIRCFRAEVHETNVPMMQILARLHIEAHPTGDGTVVFDAPLERPKGHSEDEHASLFDALTEAITNALLAALQRLRPPTRQRDEPSAGASLPLSGPPSADDLP